MTRLAGPVRQIGLVVTDIDAAITHYTDILGIGPFCLFRELRFDDDYFYMGQRAKAPVVSIAVGHSYGTQVEIIQQHNDAPSVYADFVAAGGNGFQHLSSWFSDPDEYEAARQRLIRKRPGPATGRPRQGLSGSLGILQRQRCLAAGPLHRDIRSPAAPGTASSRRP